MIFKYYTEGLSDLSLNYLLQASQVWRYEEVVEVSSLEQANALLACYNEDKFEERLRLRKSGYLVLEYFSDSELFISALKSLSPTKPYSASRFSNEDHLEVTTKGDARFSPFFMRMPNGETVENTYQLDVKGYRKLGAKSWKEVKGLPPVNTEIDSKSEYTKLMLQFFKHNLPLLYELAVLGTFKVFTDLHWVNNHGSQAETYRDILNDLFKLN